LDITADITLAANRMLPFGKTAAGASARVHRVVPLDPHTSGTLGPALHVLVLES